MDESGNQVLPYRTDGKDLTRLVEARAKGRSLKQIQALNFSSVGFQGTLATAQSLEFLDANTGDLTKRGREYALSSSNETRQQLLLQSLLEYEPYELLLAAIFDQGTIHESTTEWIETWWNTHGFGNSARNRSDGSTAFAKLVEFAELGNFYIGRRGRPSRIEWQENARQVIENAKRINPENEDNFVNEHQTPIDHNENVQSAILEDQTQTDQGFRTDINSILNEDISTLTLNLGSGKVAKLSLPSKLTLPEKDRLLKLVDLMIIADSED